LVFNQLKVLHFVFINCIAFILNSSLCVVQHLLSHYQDFLADYGMVWVGDDDADSDYDVLEETPSSVPSSLSRQQQVWNPSKTARLHLIILPSIKKVLVLCY